MLPATLDATQLSDVQITENDEVRPCLAQGEAFTLPVRTAESVMKIAALLGTLHTAVDEPAQASPVMPATELGPI